VYDQKFAAVAEAAGKQAGPRLRLVRAGGEPAVLEGLIANASPAFESVADERSLLAINYTSGTTGRPKGVMYHHRGAYLQALAMALHMGLDSDSVYLWTLPMFHCNGWCFTWGGDAMEGLTCAWTR
jgi:fatty-acyl-CoA synthase